MTAPLNVPWPLIEAILAHTGSVRVTSIVIDPCKVAITSYRVADEDDSTFLVERDENGRIRGALTQTIEYAIDGFTDVKKETT